MAKESRYFAIFGDVHGHFRLMFQLCRHWQVNHEVHLDGILLCGDIGFFPDPSRLDKATKRYVKRDPEELGFAFYMGPLASQERYRDEQLERTLLGDPEDLNTVRCPAIFCHGNHEDFRSLAQMVRSQKLTPVDFFKRIYYLQSGQTTELAGLKIAALGGAREVAQSPTSPLIGPWINPKAAQQLLGEKFDVLLTHYSPFGATREGSKLIRQVIERSQPSYQFYAHHSRPVPPYQIGKTYSYWHADVNFQKVHGAYLGPPEPSCMGLLRWKDAQDHSYEVVDGPWFRAITGSTWGQL